MHNFPKTIKSEKDLNYYSDYLEKEKHPHNAKCIQSVGDLIGSIVKIDSTVANRMESKSGVLISFDGTFLGLRQPQTGKTVFCAINAVKYITVLSKVTR